MIKRELFYSFIILFSVTISSCTKSRKDSLLPNAGKNNPVVDADYLIVNGLLYDGTTAEESYKDIAIKGDTIVFIGDAKKINLNVIKTIDAKDFMVTPGFIDPHTHCESDLSSGNAELRANLAYLRQGVTTVLTGNDGYGTINTRQQLSNWGSAGIGTNVGLFVGFGSVREEVLGKENIQPTGIQMATMKSFVSAAMADGAFGLSTALSYSPQSYSMRSGTEVKELAKMIKPFNGVYDTHLRSQSSNTLDAISEVEEISDFAGNLKVHISHIKVGPMSNYHLVDDIIAKMTAARNRGMDIMANIYPYLASADGLSGLLSSFYTTSLTVYRAKYDDPNDKSRMVTSVETYFKNIGGSVVEGAKRIVVSDPNPLWKGKSIYEISEAQQKTPANTVLDMLYTKLSIGIHTFSQSEDVMKKFLKQPFIVTGSDGVKSHPRSSGTFPEVIKKYAVEQKVQSLKQAVHTSSGLTAEIFGIKKRGVLKVGNYADILVIDLNNYKANSTYEQPLLYATGLKHIFVNGQQVVENDNYKGILAGRTLKKNQ